MEPVWLDARRLAFATDRGGHGRIGVWDGTREVINTRDNASHAYAGTGEWGDIILQFNPPRQAIAFSFAQAESPVRLVINGRDVGDFLARVSLKTVKEYATNYVPGDEAALKQIDKFIRGLPERADAVRGGQR